MEWLFMMMCKTPRCALNCNVYTTVKRTVCRKRSPKIQNAAIVIACYIMFQN